MFKAGGADQESGRACALCGCSLEEAYGQDIRVVWAAERGSMPKFEVEDLACFMAEFAKDDPRGREEALRAAYETFERLRRKMGITETEARRFETALEWYGGEETG